MVNALNLSSLCAEVVLPLARRELTGRFEYIIGVSKVGCVDRAWTKIIFSRYTLVVSGPECMSCAVFRGPRSTSCADSTNEILLLRKSG